jgi:diguanylate cyclase (GGDEF)-like protein/PAS domain S-box-containing protein
MAGLGRKVAGSMANRTLTRLLRELPDVVVVIDIDGRIQWANRAAQRLFGRSVEESIGMSGLELVHPEDLEFVLLSLGTIQSKEVGSPIEIRLRTPCGWRLMELIGAPISWFAEGSVLLSLRDLTDRRRYELSHDHDARFRTLVQSAAVVTMLVSPDGIVESCSGALTRMLGHDSDLVEGRPLADLATVDDRPAVAAALEQASRGADTAHPVTVTVCLHHAGTDISTPFELGLVNLVDDPTVGGYVVSGHDVTDRRRLEDQLSYQAFHDSLTGLGNRALFQDRLEHALARADRTNGQIALLFIDVDNFKTVNDSVGHAIGDGLLQAIARNLRGCSREADTAARLGGDEFGIIVEDVSGSDGVIHLARRILSVCRRPLNIHYQRVLATVSIGIAFSRPGMHSGDLMSGADLAMYAAKDQGKNRYEQFEPIYATGAGSLRT